MHFSPNSKCLYVVLMALLSLSAFSQNRYVDPGGVDSGDCSSSGSPCQTITYALGQAIANDIVNLAAGTYSESITIGVDITLSGANAGTIATGSRVSESIINPSSNATAISITTTGVTIDGIQIGVSNASSNATTAIASAGNTGVTIDNSIIYANSVGISLTGISSGTLRANENAIEMLDLEDQTNTGTGSVGIVLSGLTGTVDAEFTNNNLTGASWGIFGYNLDNSSDHLLIDGGTYSGCTKGIEIDNTNGSTFDPSIVDIQNVTMSGFAGPDADVTFPDAQAGIYAFVSGSATSADDVTITVDNADVSGVGNGGSDHSGVYIAGFAAGGSGIDLNATVTNSNIHDNLNRGIYVRGATATASINQSIITGNGFNPFDSDNNGYNVLSRTGGTTTVSNCTISNAATQTAFNSYCLEASDVASLTVTDCSILNNGNTSGFVARGVAGNTLDLSRNWFGSTVEATVAALMTTPGEVDFTPAIGSGTDTDGGTTGFQPDLSTLHVFGTSGTQTGGTGRWQEGHNLVDASGVVVLAHADYAETVTVSKSLTFQPTTSGSDTSLDNLVINGSSITMTLSGNLLIDNAITLTDGNIDVASGELRLGTSASDITESANSRITGLLTMDPRSVGVGSIDLLGVDIAANAADDLGNVSISRTAGAVSVVNGGASGASIQAVWDISVDSQPVNAGRDVTFTWRSEFDNSNDVSNISVYRNPGGNAWAENAGPFDASGSDPRTVTVTAVAAFSEWTLAEQGTTLPVELVSFEGSNSNGKVTLRWSTLTEINASFFEVQRSTNGKIFFPVGQVQAYGNSNVQRDYSWTDNDILIKSAFYRLRTVDFDGTFEYSFVIGLNPLLSDQVRISPNPVVDHLNIEFLTDSFTFSIFDQNGRLVQSGLNRSGSLDMSGFRSGIYLLQIEDHPAVKVIKD